MKILIVLLAFMATAQAQGVSYIGLCNKTWDCNKTMQTWKDKPIIVGWLEDSFGSKCPCANRILSSSKQKTIRVHIANSPCLRNRRCERHDIFWGYTVASANRAVRVKNSRLMRRFIYVVDRLKRRIEASRGGLTCYVSPCLECDLHETSRKILGSLVRSALPNCTFVDNPLKGDCLKNSVCERHGNDPKLRAPCISDLDGTELKTDVDIVRYYRNTMQCDLRYYWSSWMNCNGGKDTSPMPRFTSPSERRCNLSVSKMIDAGNKAWNLLSSR